jgi:hypothetical protein
VIVDRREHDKSNGRRIAAANKRGRTRASFPVNRLSSCLLTRQLLPLFKANSPSRIVTVSPVGQGAIDFSDVMLAPGYSGVRGISPTT